MKIYLYIGLVVLFLGFVYWYTDKQYDAGYNAAKADYAEESKRKQQAHDAAIAKKQAEVNNITEKWLKEKDKKQKIVYKTIVKKVKHYVKNNRACDLNRGAVSLLNKAADPSRLQRDYHPAITETESRQPSTITQQIQIEHCIGWAEQYNKIKDQLNTLIDVVEVK